ncbi:hypothetical protein NS206_06760 [Microbacterium testaceum]|nr:hypothetical protein NS206_06760 [Microbacterium testaceum]
MRRGLSLPKLLPRASVSPPWGSDIADTITSLGDYFVTADGRQLITVMDAALDASARAGKPVRIV